VSLPIAGGDHRPGEGHRPALGDLVFGRRRGLGVLRHRRGFARQSGLVGAESDGFQQAQVRGHAIAWSEQHRVPDHDFAGGHLPRRPAAEHRGGRRAQRCESGDCALRPDLVHHLDTRDGDDDREDGDRVLHLAEDKVEDTHHQEQELERLRQRLEQLAPPGFLIAFPKRVRPRAREAANGLLWHQPSDRV
jgi:hypothetical protein